jgi:hypothetical protein
MKPTARLILSISVLTLLLGAAAVFLAQDPAAAQEKKPAGQPAAQSEKYPIGYSDTPYLPDGKWRVHDIDRPRPRVITPGTSSTAAQPGLPPSDAIVLFDGKDLSQWLGAGPGGNTMPPAWKVENGYMEVTPGAPGLISKEKLGDCQIHVEWAAPKEIQGASQGRGNSGILIMSRYEIQVLDSYNNVTYADGQAGAMYGQYPPLVNAVRPPGEWNFYDIVFEAPRFTDGKLVKPATATVFLNGVLLHNRMEFIGQTGHKVVAKYSPHAAEEPLSLQNHSNPIRYRNIWVRKLRGYDQP